MHWHWKVVHIGKANMECVLSQSWDKVLYVARVHLALKSSIGKANNMECVMSQSWD